MFAVERKEYALLINLDYLITADIWKGREEDEYDVYARLSMRSDYASEIMLHDEEVSLFLKMLDRANNTKTEFTWLQ